MRGLGLKSSMTHKQISRKNCARCELYYSEEETECPHCPQWTDEQVLQVKQHMLNQKAKSQKLGKRMLFAGIVLAVFVIAILLALA